MARGLAAKEQQAARLGSAVSRAYEYLIQADDCEARARVGWPEERSYWHGLSCYYPAMAKRVIGHGR